MKKMILCSFILASTVTAALAQVGTVSILADGSNPGQGCYIFEEAAPTFANAGLAIVHDNHQGAKAVFFTAPVPPCHGGQTITETLVVVGVLVGTLSDGAAIGYGLCLNAPIVVATRSWVVGGVNSGQCCEWQITDHPGLDASNLIPGIFSQDCADIVHCICGKSGYVVVGPAGNWDPSQCPQCPSSECAGPACEQTVPVHETTWGAVKAVYKDN